jgi:Leucine-rich repeat (LRR) protein
MGNGLNEIPREVGNMKNLRELELANNRLTTLPGSLSQLKKLEEIEIKGNPISNQEVARLEKTLKGVEIEF